MGWGCDPRQALFQTKAPAIQSPSNTGVGKLMKRSLQKKKKKSVREIMLRPLHRESEMETLKVGEFRSFNSISNSTFLFYGKCADYSS